MTNIIWADPKTPANHTPKKTKIRETYEAEKLALYAQAIEAQRDVWKKYRAALKKLSLGQAK